jgi:hypothetical protein
MFIHPKKYAASLMIHPHMGMGHFSTLASAPPKNHSLSAPQGANSSPGRTSSGETHPLGRLNPCLTHFWGGCHASKITDSPQNLWLKSLKIDEIL